MSNNPIPATLPGRMPKKPFARKSCLLPAIGLATLVLFIVAAVVGYLLFREPAAKPSVLINSPRNGERLGAGQATIVQAIARGEKKIKRVELWVDGKLTDAQASALPGGTSPFPLVVSWRAPTPGAHTLTVRAFDTTNARGHASINVETLSSADRDHDNVPDATDVCPDQPGLTTNNGCPVPTTGDRDGDGVADASDACADQLGTTLADGCPDADGDGIRDSDDACPSQFGVLAGNGCPSPNDTDNDGLPNASDRCPSEPGPAQTSGCPATEEATNRDRDGDGVLVPQDLCPDVPGPASNAGCPPTGTGDSDRDGVDDGTDLAPTESGPADSGGAPPPGGGEDEDADGIADDEEPESSADESFPDMGGSETVWLVRIDALEFGVTRDYEEVYCYVQSHGIAERFGPFDLVGIRQWNIAEFIGGANSRTIPVTNSNLLNLHIECSGHYPTDGPFSIAPADVGSITRSYARDQWDGHVIEESSGDSGESGHSFRVKFRLCLRSCESSEFPPPVLRISDMGVGRFVERQYLAWSWSGDEDDITGYKLYVAGNHRATINASRRNRVRLSRYDPPCGETYEYYVTAYRRGVEVRESPPSNIVTAEGEVCPRTVLVSFVRFETGDLRGLGPAPGPIYGSFWAGDERRDFDTSYRVRPNNSHNITDFFPRTDFTANLALGDSLYISARIVDRDPGSGGDNDEVLFDSESSILPTLINTGEHTITGRDGNKVVVRISVPPANASAASDRNIKSNISAVDPRDVLTRLSQVPVSTWNYTSDGTAARHIGVMAQDFSAAFGVGETDTRIMQVDADGVAFAAIQGLYQVVQERDAEIQTLKSQNAKSTSEISALEARVAALEQRPGDQPLGAQPVPLDTFLPWLAMWLAVGAAIGIGFARAKH